MQRNNFYVGGWDGVHVKDLSSDHELPNYAQDYSTVHYNRYYQRGELDLMEATQKQPMIELHNGLRHAKHEENYAILIHGSRTWIAAAGSLHNSA